MINYTSLFDISQKIVELYRQNLAQSGMRKEGALYNFKWNVNFDGQDFELIFRLPKEWYFVEYGRKPSMKMPPVNAIMQWIEVRKIVPQARNGKVPTTKSLAFAIAKKIQKEGFYSPNHHGLKPLERTFQQGRSIIQELCDEMSKLLMKEVKEDVVKIFDGLKTFDTK